MYELSEIHIRLNAIRQYIHTMPLVVLARKLMQLRQDYPQQVNVSYRCEATMHYSPREIVNIIWSDHDGVADVEVTVGYFGLQTTDSPLPLNTHEIAIKDVSSDNYGLNEFYNFFNHRFIELLSLGHIKLDVLHPVSNTQKIWPSLIGLNATDDSGRDSFLRKLWSMSPLLLGSRNSSNNIAKIIQLYFAFDQVKLEHYIERNVYLGSKHRSVMGKQNCGLGTTMILGTMLKDRQNSCRVHIYLQNPYEYLPNGRQFSLLKKLIEFLLPKHMLYHIALHLPENIPAILKTSTLYLGWTTLLTQKQQPQTIHLKG